MSAIEKIRETVKIEKEAIKAAPKSTLVGVLAIFTVLVIIAVAIYLA